MRPQFRFTLTHLTVGTQEISEPEGWSNIQINLERDPKYHSLIENFELPLIFYGSNGEIDGGYSFLSNVLAIGKDEEVGIYIEIRYYDDPFEEFFTGQIDISEYKRIDFRKIQAPIIRENLWARFINRASTEVTIGETISIDGDSLSAINPTLITLPGQIINTYYRGYLDAITLQIRDGTWIVNDYIQMQPDIEEVNEIQDTFIYPFSVNPDIPASMFIAVFDGDYIFDLQIEDSGRINSPTTLVEGGTYVTWYIQKNSEAAVAFTKTNYGTGLYKSTLHTYSGTLSLLKGDEVRIYAQIIADLSGLGSPAFYQVWSYATTTTPAGLGIGTETKPTEFNVTAETTYIDTESEVYQIGEVAHSIISQITGIDNCLESEYFLNGAECGYEYVLIPGLNVRGYSLTEKPFRMSWGDWFEGTNPLFNIGVGYGPSDTSPEVEVIKIKPKSSFYDDSSNSISLTGVNGIEIELDKDLLYKNILIGYEKWEAESSSGIDDPQTRKKYRTRFKVFGQDLSLLSRFYAASSGIEQTRRNRKEEGKDWRLDEDVFIIATQSNATEVELINESPETITNLLNSHTRYNIRLTPARSLQRWLDFLSGQLNEYYATEKFYFTSGEGNYKMAWEGDACDTGTLAEDQDINVTSNHLFLPEVYSFTHSLTWQQYKAIRLNKEKSISISWVDYDGLVFTKTMFIKKILYEVTKAKAQFLLWPV